VAGKHLRLRCLLGAGAAISVVKMISAQTVWFWATWDSGVLLSVTDEFQATIPFASMSSVAPYI
jgi:hypothetical protein